MPSHSPSKAGAFVKTSGTCTTNEEALARLEHYRQAYLDIVPNDNFDVELWKSVKGVDAEMSADGKTGKATFSLVTPERYGNYTGHVMGGAVATIIDGTTNCAIALIARKNFWDRSGVTRNLNITYLRPVKRGEKLIVECEILRSSPLLVTIRGVVKRASDGKLLATGIQEMVAIKANL